MKYNYWKIRNPYSSYNKKKPLMHIKEDTNKKYNNRKPKGVVLGDFLTELSNK